MENAKFLASKLEALSKSCRDATTEFEKAAIYAASQSVCSVFQHELKLTGEALEKLMVVRWHISASLGFDVTNQHPLEFHYSQAIGAAEQFRDILIRQYKL